MMKKYFYFLLLTFAVFSAVQAETVPFRGGEVLAAQLSTRKPHIAGEDPQEFPVSFEKKIYAAVVVKLMPGRALSIFDYSLKAFGLPYECIAIRAGNGTYNAAVPTFQTTNSAEKYTMLFQLDGSVIGFTSQEKLELKANYADGANSAVTLFFENLGGRDFTPPAAIPATGIMKAGK